MLDALCPLRVLQRALQVALVFEDHPDVVGLDRNLGMVGTVDLFVNLQRAARIFQCAGQVALRAQDLAEVVGSESPV